MLLLLTSLRLRILCEHPGILAAAALRRVDYQRAFSHRHPCKPSRDYVNLFAAEDIWPQIHVPAFEMIVNDGGDSRERERRLGDEVARIGLDLARELLALLHA